MISSSTIKCSPYGPKIIFESGQIYNIKIITWDFPISDGLCIYGGALIEFRVLRDLKIPPFMGTKLRDIA